MSVERKKTTTMCSIQGILKDKQCVILKDNTNRLMKPNGDKTY